MEISSTEDQSTPQLTLSLESVTADMNDVEFVCEVESSFGSQTSVVVIMVGDDGATTGAIAGGVVGGVAFLLIVLVLLILLCCCIKG